MLLTRPARPTSPGPCWPAALAASLQRARDAPRRARPSAGGWVSRHVDRSLYTCTVARTSSCSTRFTRPSYSSSASRTLEIHTHIYTHTPSISFTPTAAASPRGTHTHMTVQSYNHCFWFSLESEFGFCGVKARGRGIRTCTGGTGHADVC